MTRHVSPPPALVLDGELRQSLVAVRSLGRAGVSVTVASARTRPLAAASRYCSSHVAVPEVGDDPAEFVTRLHDLCARLGRPVVLASHDGTIEAIRRHRQELESVARIGLAREGALARAVDKRETLAAAARAGLPVPPTVEVSSWDEVPQRLSELDLPIVIKPATSWTEGGWRAAPVLVRDQPGAGRRIHELLAAGVPALLQPWLSGAREAVSTLREGGTVHAMFAQRADRVTPLIGGTSVLRESIVVPDDLREMTIALLDALDLDAYAEVEFRRGADGTAYLMEINPRLSASVEVAVRAGVDFPLLLYRHAAGQPLPRSVAYRPGVRMRFLGGDVAWLKEAIRDPGHPDAPASGAALRAFLLGFARPSGYDVWDWRDVRPAAGVARGVVASAPRRGARIARRALLRGRERARG